jgi:hypothetical protein
MRFAHDVLNIIIDSTYNRLCRIPHNGILGRSGTATCRTYPTRRAATDLVMNAVRASRLAAPA